MARETSGDDRARERVSRRERKRRVKEKEEIGERGGNYVKGPTTPLSWSGATSLSGGSGGAGDEGSSTPAVLKPPRSKSPSFQLTVSNPESTPGTQKEETEKENNV
ncbi:chlorophyll A-B binding family protein [Striga asiatica]|uniref:Chlorophyll A-B binding family protein n=1 Tax=Striga asiatica TaxID=4170 RepID=A0A5A7Q367_STRAF|nr:chlorophyll A-B binding family protein [Striga asiatica]